MRRRQWNIPIAVLAVGLAGCGSSGGGATTRTFPTAPSTTAASTTAASTTAPSTTTPATTTLSPGTRPPGKCATSDLAASVGSGNGTAGTIYYQLKVRNISSTPCYEQGYAGVSLLDSSGRQIGAAAARLSAEEPTVVLAPGQTAYATLGVTEAGNFPSSCVMTPAAELQVYPPNQTTALTVSFNVQGCSDTADELLHIKPFTSSPPS